MLLIDGEKEEGGDDGGETLCRKAITGEGAPGSDKSARGRCAEVVTVSCMRHYFTMNSAGRLIPHGITGERYNMWVDLVNLVENRKMERKPEVNR